jgi:uncharacterized tellurite resistance protein B-like protein
MADIIQMDVALLKALAVKVTALEAQVSVLRRDLAAVRRNAASDVLYQIAMAFQRLPEIVEAKIRKAGKP